MSDHKGLQALFRAIDWGSELEARAAVERATLPAGAVPEGWVIGKAFVFVAEGKVYDRWEGHQRGLDVTEADIDSALAIWRSGDTSCAIDYEHDEDRPIGLVVAMWRVDRGGKAALACLPAYSPEGADLVGNASHLWSSPHLCWNATAEETRRPYVTADTGETVGGSMMIPHLAVCKDPAQSHRVLTAVRLSTDASDATDASPIATERVTETEKLMNEEEMKALLDAIMSRLDALEKGLSALQEGKAEASEGEMSEEASQGASEDALKAEALSARNAALEARLKALEEQNLKHEMGQAIDALLSSKRLTPAEKATAEKVYRQSKSLFEEVYGSRSPVIPTLKGHGGVEASSLDEQRDGVIRARMSADKTPYHVTAVTLRREGHPLFAINGGDQ